MSDTKKKILDEFEHLKGQFVIACDWKVKRLLGVVGDEWDYYWLLYDGRRYSLDSCLCRLVPLKGKIDKDDYNEFVRLAYLNHYDLLHHSVSEEEIDDEEKQSILQFSINHKQSITSELLDKENNNELLTEICWELNKIQ